jgi:undecaprenyl-diphosphatase
MNVWQGFLLGLIQGIAEWLPVSSEALVAIIGVQLLGLSPQTIIDTALLLHLGTALAIAGYFKDELLNLMKSSRSKTNYRQFIIVTTAMSLVVGGPIYLGLKQITAGDSAGSILTIIMGVALLFTAWLLKRSGQDIRTRFDVSKMDGLWLGITQGLAVIPGISRSGSTTAVSLWRGFSTTASLENSFIIGLPIMIIGSALLLWQGEGLQIITSPGGVVALATAAIVGYLTIGWLLRIAKDANFSVFVFGFGVLAVVAGLIQL